MSTNRIHLGAAACFLSAALGAALLPSVALAPDQVAANIIALISMIVYLIIVLTLRGALADRLGYRMPFWLVAGLIFGHLGLAAASVIDDLSGGFAPLALALVWTASLVLAVSLVALSFVIWKLRSDLGVVGIVLATLLAIEGLLFGTMVFMANAILLAVVTDLLLGWTLLGLAGRPARDPEQSAELDLSLGDRRGVVR